MDPDLVPENLNIINHLCQYFTITEFNSKFCSASDNNNRPTGNNAINKYFSLLHINARSLNKNFDSIEVLLNSLNQFPFSVIGITETWLHTSSPNMFDIQNYSMIRADRRTGRGGGVAMYIYNNLRYKPRPDLQIDDIESLFIEVVNDKNKNTIIGVIYRPPNNQIDSFFRIY